MERRGFIRGLLIAPFSGLIARLVPKKLSATQPPSMWGVAYHASPDRIDFANLKRWGHFMASEDALLREFQFGKPIMVGSKRISRVPISFR